MHADASRRIPWVDAARGLGMALVFLGHSLQSAAPYSAAAADLFRLLYSFHVPFFFVLSGCVTHLDRPFPGYAKTLLLRLLLPVLFFGLCFGAAELLRELHHGHVETALLGNEAGGYLIGQPDFDWVTWFLVCLFMCELLAYWVARCLSGTTAQLLAGGLMVIAGAWLGDHSQQPADGGIYFIARFWFLSEAIAATGFFFVGRALVPWLMARLLDVRLASAMAVLGLLTVLVTYRWNVVMAGAGVVMMAARQHGNVFCFLLTALAGSAAVLGVGALLRDSRLFALLGRNSLALLGLNGIFFQYLNGLLVARWQVPQTHVGVLLAAVGVTALSLLACAPVIAVLNRLLPQVIGRPGVAGPLFPALDQRRVVH